MNKMLALKGSAVAVFCALLLAATWYGLRPSDPSGPYSALTRSQLKTVSSSADIFVPANLPSGLNASASSSDFNGGYEVQGETFRGDDVAFFLSRVLAATDLPEHRKEVVTQYQSVALGGSDEVRYEVHQLPEGMRATGRCSKSVNTLIERRSEGTTLLLVCSTDPGPGTKARSYWTSVPFTNQLQSVDWLRGDS